MTTYDWPTIRADAIARFGGDAPRAELEQQIIDVFAQQPQLVVLAIDKIADSYRAGKVRSPWAVLKTHIERSAEPGAPITATDTTAKQKAIQRAEQWIRAAGIHYDRDTEILLELFSGSGLLASYATVDLVPDDTDTGKWKLGEPTGDTALVERILRAYHDARPTGIALEHEAQARADKYRHQQSELRQALAQARAELDQKQTHRKPLPDADYSATEEPVPF